MSEDDILASSSAGWKAVALPEPAKMVSLPELAELPSAVEIERKDKASRAEAKAAAADAKAAAVEAKAEAKRTKAESKAPSDAVAAPAVAVAPVSQIGARIAAKQQSGGRGRMIAIVGTLAAAAAGVGIFFVMQKSDDKTAPAAAVAQKTETAMPALAPPPEVKVAPIEPPAEVVAVVEPPAAPPPPVEEKVEAKDTKKDKVHKVEIRDDRPAPKEVAKPAVKKEEEPKQVKGGEGEPSFDDLLKEAGVQEKQAAKPKLEKKDLSASDFKNGMSSVAGKAKACYKGTQGTAKFKVAIASSGSVASVTMKGDFAGAPEGACVEAAVKSASFPPWDGPQKSFDYSYLLSD